MNDKAEFGFVGFILISLMFAVTCIAQERSLAGFRYMYVNPPRYGDQVDIHGFARFLEEELRKDATWTLLQSRDANFHDRQRLSETLFCNLSHTLNQTFKNSVTLDLRDVLGKPIYSLEASATSFSSDARNDVRNAIKDVLKKLRKVRPNFDQSRTVDLIETLGNLERVDLPEKMFESYLAENTDRLSPLEGIWSDQKGTYRIAIRRDAKSSMQEFVAIVLSSKHIFWNSGMIKARFTGTAYDNTFIARIFMGDHAEVGTTAKLEGGLLSMPVQYLNRDEVITFIKISPQASRERTLEPERQVSLSSGTGFVCSNGVIVTNYHVLGGQNWDVMFPSTGESYSLKPVLLDKANDIALLRMIPREGKGPATLRPLKIVGSAAARLGEGVYTIGFPLGELLGSSHKVATGVLSSGSGLSDDPRMFQITVPTQPGNSGGPVLNEKGEVIGILASSLSVDYLYREQRTIPQNVNFAIKSDYLLTLLRQVSDASTEHVLDAESLHRADQIIRSKDSVGQVRSFE